MRSEISGNSLRKRILIVEDDWMSRGLLKIKLEKQGYDVVMAQNEKEFWRQALTTKMDLIILDMHLKRRLGTDVYRSLLDFGLNERIPVIFITGMTEHDASSEISSALRDEHYTFFEKPVNFEKLCEEIEYLLKEQPAQKAA